VATIFNLFKRKKPKLSKKDQEDFLRLKEMRERFIIEYEKGFYTVYLDGDIAERFNDKKQANQFIETVIVMSRVGEMDYKLR